MNAQLQLLGYLLPGILLGIVDYFLFSKNKNWYFKIIRILLEYVVSYNVFFIALMKFVFNKQDIINPELFSLKFTFFYILKALLLGLGYLFIKGIFAKLMSSSNNLEISKKPKVWIVVGKILAVLFVTIGATFKYFAEWFVNYFGNITPEQFMFNLNSPLEGTGGGMMKEIITNPLLHVLLWMFLAIFVVNIIYNIYLVIKAKNYKFLSLKWYQLIVLSIAIVIMTSYVTYGSQKLHFKAIYQEYFKESNYIEKNYVDPRDVSMTFPKQKRNLIHIHLESVENSYFSQDLGGYMQDNSIPELAEIHDEGDSFSNSDANGGPHQIYGTSWSIASMMNMMAGVPMKIADYGKSDTFLPGIIAIGDILEAEGYEQTIMFGSDISFGGLSTYFRTHGNFKQFDLKYAREQGLIPKDYFEWWGFEDEKLYEYAKNEITRLAETGKPFNFTMETADTHFPDGWLSPNAPTPYDSQYANVISFSSKQAFDFINWLKEQPFYENTTVVITGDHLSMDEKFFVDWDPNYERTIYNVILNSAVENKDESRFKNRDYSNFDFYPTILESMGIDVKGDRLGMGTNLYSDKPTLIERDGLDKVNEELSMKSDFYMDTFINTKNNNVFPTDKVKTRE